MIEVNYERMNHVFEKFHLNGLPFPLVLHKFTGLEHGPAHDHPFDFRSFVLYGGYTEEVYSLDGSMTLVTRNVGESFDVTAGHIHRIVDLPLGECWTAFQPLGPKVREPGFYEFYHGVAFHRPWHRPDFQLLQQP